MGDTEPAPNTAVGVPGVGTVLLNEQVPTGGGANTTGGRPRPGGEGLEEYEQRGAARSNLRYGYVIRRRA